MVVTSGFIMLCGFRYKVGCLRREYWKERLRELIESIERLFIVGRIEREVESDK